MFPRKTDRIPYSVWVFGEEIVLSKLPYGALTSWSYCLKSLKKLPDHISDEIDHCPIFKNTMANANKDTIFAINNELSPHLQGLSAIMLTKPADYSYYNEIKNALNELQKRCNIFEASTPMPQSSQ